MLSLPPWAAAQSPARCTVLNLSQTSCAIAVLHMKQWPERCSALLASFTSRLPATCAHWLAARALVGPARTFTARQGRGTVSACQRQQAADDQRCVLSSHTAAKPASCTHSREAFSTDPNRPTCSPALTRSGGLMRGEPGRGEAVGEHGWRSFSMRAACVQGGAASFLSLGTRVWRRVPRQAWACQAC